MSWDDKSTNQIQTDLKQLQARHQYVKMEMLKLLDELEDIEKDFVEGNKILNKRINNVK